MCSNTFVSHENFPFKCLGSFNPILNVLISSTSCSHDDIKYHNLSLRRSIHRDTFRVCKHLENYSRDHVSTWTIHRTSRREMLRREVERLYRSFEQGTFERGGGGFNLRWMHDRAENARGKRRGLGSKIHNGVEENAEGERGGDTFFERTFREIFSNLSLSRFSLTPRPLFLASPPRLLHE